MHLTNSWKLLAATLTFTLTACVQAPIQLSEMGSFHIGGREVVISGKPTKEVLFSPGGVPAKVDPNGVYQAEQMYVQYVKLAKPQARYPMLMWHGGGLTGVTYESTPDGREGWAPYFLRRGYPVYVVDPPGRGRAGFSPDGLIGMEANLRFAGPETMETKIFARLSAWQNWIFQRPNATGPEGALKLYGSGKQAKYDRKRA